MLLPLLVASTSVLGVFPGVFPGGPATTKISAETGEGHQVTVEVALSRAEGEVPVPIRITGGDIDVEAVICDGPACTAGRTVHIPARGMVEDVAVVEDGRPNLRFTNDVTRPARVACCSANQATGRVVAVVGAVPSEALSTFMNGNPVVHAVPVGRLLDERPEQLGNVGAVVLVDGDLDHDDAFFVQLRRFVQLGGLVSVDSAQAARLRLGPSTSMADLHAHDLAVAFQSGTPENVDIAVEESRRVRSFVIDVEHVPTVRGAVHVVDNGLVIVRDAGLDPLDAITDLVRARPRFVFARGHDWRANGELSNALLVGLQPQPSPLPMIGWFLLTFGVVFVVARVVVTRRRGLDGPVVAVGAVVGVLVLSGAAAVVVGASASSWRTTAVRVVGAGQQLRTTALVTARSPDFSVEMSAFSTGLDAEHRTFVADGYSYNHNLRRSHFGAGIAEVTVRAGFDEGPGHLAIAGTSATNHFAHPIDIHSRSGLTFHLAPGASVDDADWSSAVRSEQILSLQVSRLVDVVRQRCSCTVATFVDDDGVNTIVEGTIR